jgi:hypothetical protein
MSKHLPRCPKKEAFEEKKKLLARDTEKIGARRLPLHKTKVTFTMGGKMILAEVKDFMVVNKYASRTIQQYLLKLTDIISHWETIFCGDDEEPFLVDYLLYSLETSWSMPTLSTYLEQNGQLAGSMKRAIQAHKVLCKTLERVFHRM